MLIYSLLGQCVLTVFTHGIFTECLYVRNFLNSGGTEVNKTDKSICFLNTLKV